MNIAHVFPGRPMLRVLVVGLAFFIAACTSMQPDQVVAFSASMAAANEVPPNNAPGTGMVDASYDKATMVLHYRITFTGLTGPATMAHFHGPAVAGANAGVVVPFASPHSPIEGEAQLTAEQGADLLAGKWYANVHTTEHKGGEIRGQLLPRM